MLYCDNRTDPTPRGHDGLDRGASLKISKISSARLPLRAGEAPPCGLGKRSGFALGIPVEMVGFDGFGPPRALQGAARLGKTINHILISRAAAPATEVEATPVNLALRVSIWVGNLGGGECFVHVLRKSGTPAGLAGLGWLGWLAGLAGWARVAVLFIVG